MTPESRASSAVGLERPPGGPGGVEFLRARLTGRAYARHRHDTYAICVTDHGIQAFDYRGAARASTPGEVVVLHPDEAHDGRVGTEEGFGYRIAYIAPARIAEAARALCGAEVPLPFVGEPVSRNVTLARAVMDAFQGFPAALEPLAIDALIDGVTRGLVAADPSIRLRRRRVVRDRRAVERVRQFLDAERSRVVTSAELEAISGHDRFALARQFRQVHGTSPYRYLLMRRLDWARREIMAGGALARIAAEAGFADQSHLTRMFKASYGISPARFRTVAQSGPA